MHSSPAPSSSPRKWALIFDLEDVLIPGKAFPYLDVAVSHAWLNNVNKYRILHPDLLVFLISGYKEDLVWKKLAEFDLEKYFDKAHVYGVNDAYLQGRADVDRKLYEAKCETDAECTDEYFRQVQIQSLLAEKKFTKEEVVLIGHDYWFDGFYTRRFGGIDMAFVEDQLTSRGKPAPEKVPGVWYVDRKWASLKKIVEGKVPRPNYAPLDTWISVTLTEELLGAKGIPQLKRVILERKKDGSGFDVTKMG